MKTEKNYKRKEIEFLKESNYIEGERSIEALVNAGWAWEYAKHNRDSFSVHYVKEIHYRLMKRINPRIAGKIRSCQVEVTGGPLPCIIPEDISYYLGLWVKTKPSNEIAIKKFNVIFNIIHPFEDGNGRTSRILMNIQRLNLGLPLLVIKESEKQKYYDWFN